MPFPSAFKFNPCFSSIDLFLQPILLPILYQTLYPISKVAVVPAFSLDNKTQTENQQRTAKLLGRKQSTKTQANPIKKYILIFEDFI